MFFLIQKLYKDIIKDTKKGYFIINLWLIGKFYELEERKDEM